MNSEEFFKKMQSIKQQPSCLLQELQPGDVCYCIKTSGSKKPKPIEGNFYICRKVLNTKWGTKVIVVDVDSKEVWGDIKNMVLVEKKAAKEINENLIDKLNHALHKKILEECTPAICEVLKKNYSGLEVLFTSGSKLFVSRKIIYPESIYHEALAGETISINLPVWFAYKNNIINNIKE